MLKSLKSNELHGVGSGVRKWTITMSLRMYNTKQLDSHKQVVCRYTVGTRRGGIRDGFATKRERYSVSIHLRFACAGMLGNVDWEMAQGRSEVSLRQLSRPQANALVEREPHLATRYVCILAHLNGIIKTRVCTTPHTHRQSTQDANLPDDCTALCAQEGIATIRAQR